MQELKNRSRRDNVHVITLPEGTYGSNAARFLSTFHAEWFPELADKQIEIIRVHGIGPERNADRRRTLIFRLLLNTDWDYVLKSNRSWM